MVDISAKPVIKHCSNEHPVRLYATSHVLIYAGHRTTKRTRFATNQMLLVAHLAAVHAKHLNSQNKSNYNNLTAASCSAGAASASEEHKDDSATLQASQAALHLRLQRHHQSCGARLELSLHFYRSVSLIFSCGGRGKATAVAQTLGL